MKHLFIIAVALFAITSCSNDSDAPADLYLPEANGQHGEILILMDDYLWDGTIGEAVIENLSQQPDGPYLRPETLFGYFRKKPEDLNHLNQLNRNILKLMIDNDSTYAETAIITKNNYYAKNQLFVIVKDSDINRLYDFAKNGMDPILDQFNDFEKQQLIRAYNADYNQRVKEITSKNFNLAISIPSKAKIRLNKPDFLMVKNDRSKNLLANDATKASGGTFWIQQGFLFWSTPYVAGSNQLTVAGALADRDSTLKAYVPGPSEGTYMGTEYTPGYAPEGRVFNYKGNQAVEVRGLWIYDGTVFIGGGGPFVQYSILNEKENEIVTVSGYVYGPKYDKREYIRELDAILSTIVLNP